MKDYISQFISELGKEGFTPKHRKDVVPSTESRLIANEKGKKSLYYSLIIENDRAYGRFYDCSTGDTGFWHSRGNKDTSADERKAIEKAREAAIKAEKKAKDERHSRVRDELLPKIKGLPLAENHPYLERKKVKAWRARQDGDLLVLPLVDVAGQLWSCQTIDVDGEKKYQREGKKNGCFFPIGWKPADGIPDTLVICEGFSTGASIHQATELPVACAMDTSGVLNLALPLRQASETAHLIFAADNDAWVLKHPRPKALAGLDMADYDADAPEWAQWREAGYCVNPGMEAAQQAALKVNGQVAVPVFKDVLGKPTDFNDLACREGLEQVRLIFEALSAPPEPEPEQAQQILDSVGDVRKLPFKVLGYRDRVFYYYSFSMGDIVALNSYQHKYDQFLELARDKDWRQAYANGGDFKRHHVTEAADEMMECARQKGVYDDGGRVRGVGAWVDAGRLIIHTGPVAYVDGHPTAPHNIVSAKYVYVKGEKIFDTSQQALTRAERDAFIRITEMITWEDPVNAVVMRGFIVTALFGSALKWRPHIWVTGEHGAGKSFVMEQIIIPGIGDMALNLSLGTTESKLRELIGYSGRPLIYDEAEGDSMTQKNTMLAVVALARLASDGKYVSKKGQRTFKAQFSACFSSVNPVISEKADESRIMRLKIRRNTADGADQHFAALESQVKALIDRRFSGKLITLVSNNWTAFQENIDRFKAAAKKSVKNARAADQIAPLMAGAYLFESDGLVNEEYAEQWVSQYDWTYHTTSAEDSDSESILKYILRSIIRIQHPVKGAQDMSIQELLLASAGRGDINYQDAQRFLLHYGIKYHNNKIIISNRNQNLARLLKDKPAWVTGDGGWSGILASLPGAERPQGAVYFGLGAPKQRAVIVPADILFESEKPQNSQPKQEEEPWEKTEEVSEEVSF